MPRSDKRGAESFASVDHFGDDFSQIEDYHESTKITRANLPQLADRVGQVNTNPDVHRITMQGFKTYASAKRIALPPARLGDAPLEAVLRSRRSQTGNFAPGSIALEQLSAILRYSAGPTTKPSASGVYPIDATYLRASPSAGGLHPTELYPLVMNVDGCEPGLYHYSVRSHELELLRAGDLTTELTATLTDPRPAVGSAVTIFLTSVMTRNLSKYLFRGYRFLSYDVGALLQSLYLTTTTCGLGTCAVGGFHDDAAGDFLRIDNVHECVHMLFCIGHRAPGPLAKKTTVAVTAY